MTDTNKRIVAGLPAMVLALSVCAAPLTPEEAQEAIADFHVRNAKAMKAAKVNGNGSLTLAYTRTSPSGNCFYIFNRPNEGGFVIASADDRLPAVLGFTESGSYEEGKENANFRYWLGEYACEIESYLKEDPKVGHYVQGARPLDNEPIAPLMTTKWDQGKPYNNQCPYDSYAHATAVTGCVATAMAQVMKYHNWPINPTGVHNGYIFNNTTLDWDQMIDVYENGHYTTSQADAVALLMRQCGVSVDMQYSYYGSGAYANDVQVAWRDYFGYNPGLEHHFRDYYSYREWKNMVYEELSTNGPVIYFGQSSQGGHAFVCDGYLGNDFYHFNWGWGGYQDGYFLLNALNPATGGAGSSAGGYNADQSIYTGVRKADGSDYHIQEQAISTGAFEYNNGRFVITKSPDNFNEIYNPQAYAITCGFGVKIVPFDGEGEPRYVIAFNTTLGRWAGFDSMSLTMPTLPDGMYKVSPAMLTSYGEWKDVGVPVNMQTYVTMEIKGGKASYINQGAAAEGRPLLLAGSPVVTSKMYGYTSQVLRATVSNVGDGDFSGNIYMTLEDNVDPFGDSYSSWKWVSVPSHFSVDIDFTSEYQLMPGEYVFELFDSSFNYLSNGEIVTVDESDFEELDLSDDFRIEDVEPRFVTQSPDGIGLVMKCINPTKSNYDLSIDVNFLEAENLSQIYTAHGEGLTIEKNTQVLVNFPIKDVNLQPGSYFMEIKDKNGELLSPVSPLIVVSDVKEKDGISYIVTSEKARKATVVAPQTQDYEGSVTIPAYIDGYEVDAIKSSAMTFADNVTDVSIPSTVKSLQAGTFYLAEGLREFQVRSSEPPTLSPNAFNPTAEQRIVLYTPDGAANYYGHNDGWDVLSISNWTINLGEGVEIVEGLMTDPLTNEFYSPYYLSAREPLEFEVALPAGLYPLAEYSVDGQNPVRKGFGGNTITLPALNGASATLMITADDGSGISILSETKDRVDVYSVDGKLVLRGATPDTIRLLPRGFYIAGGRKIKI